MRPDTEQFGHKIFCTPIKNQNGMTYHFFMGSTFYIYTINLKTDMIGRKLFVM